MVVLVPVVNLYLNVVNFIARPPTIFLFPRIARLLVITKYTRYLTYYICTYTHTIPRVASSLFGQTIRVHLTEKYTSNSNTLLGRQSSGCF
jgi:hypothetical protein